MELTPNIPTIVVGYVPEESGLKNLSIALCHNGLLQYSKPQSCKDHDMISTCVYAAISGIMEVLQKIGAQELNILNGKHLFEGPNPADCFPIPEDIFEEFAGRLRLFIQTFLVPVATTA